MKGVATLAGVRRRIGQRSGRVEKLHDRPWPAVDEHQWSGIGRHGPHMQKMHGRAIDDGGVLRETVEVRLVPAPVITRAPVLRELYEIAERDASFPTDAGQLSRPASSPPPEPQVVDFRPETLDS